MPEIKKVVIKLDIHDDKHKRKVLNAVSTLSGIESLAVELKDQKLTVVGVIDPVEVSKKLKKWHPTIVTVGPAKDDKKGKGYGKKDKDDENYTRWLEETKPWMYTNYPPVMTPQYYVREENPNGCVIC